MNLPAPITPVPVLTLAAALVLSALPAQAREIQTSAGALQVTQVVDNLIEPWAFGFLPEGGVLITERGGRLLHVAANGDRVALDGLPPIEVGGQGGLLDVLIPRDFATSREVFLSYVKRQGRGEGTALMRAVWPEGSDALQDVHVIFEMEPGTSGGRHFGSRIVEGRDGTLFLTIGDRGDRDSAQDLSVESGTVVRLNRDGSVPADNPFVNTPGAQPEIYSYGHRNPQGAAMAPDGTLYIVEHGARGGDEVNVAQAGANFGWPVISYGRHYSGFKIGEGTAKPGMEQPAFYWDPSIAPSGATVYTGGIGDWAGDLFVGSLKFDYIARLDTANGLAEVEQIQLPETDRVRDVRTGPDGGLWFLSVGNDALFRIAPR